MKIHVIAADSAIYSSNAYLLCGNHNKIEDINTLIDAGSDPTLIKRIQKINTGVGKRAVAQVLITHNHSDHTLSLHIVKEEWQTKIMAFSQSMNAERVLKHNDIIKVADTWAQVIHIPEHSSDSVCFYFPDEKALFSGDTELDIRSLNGTYDEVFCTRIKELSKLKIDKIYPGHGDVIAEGSKIIKRSLKFLEQGQCTKTALI
jgi:glyoxylase-like metal-dependent hydrolase (beta-lactamase superfamily II)